MFSVGFEKVAGRIGKAIDDIGRNIGVGKATVQKTRDTMAKYIVEARDKLRKTTKPTTRKMLRANTGYVEGIGKPTKWSPGREKFLASSVSVKRRGSPIDLSVIGGERGKGR